MPYLQREAVGEYGGTVTRKFSGAGRDWVAGDEISAELAARWPLPNRITLRNSGYVYWYAAPDGARQGPESILVDLGDGTLVTAPIERTEDGEYVARLSPIGAENAPRPTTRRGRQH